MGKTIISWATHTCNVVHGCSKPAAVPAHVIPIAEKVSGPIPPKWLNSGTSPECFRCYAEKLSNMRGWTPLPWQEENIEANLRLQGGRISEARSVKVKDTNLPPSKRERFFICSMGDIFHESVPFEFVESIWPTLLEYRHIYMLLTKRPDRAAEFPGPWPDHIWLGATCGHPFTKWRLEFLRASRAQVRFVSMEPMLASMVRSVNPIDGRTYGMKLDGIDQVIVGGESGQGYRPMYHHWAREVRDQCVRAKRAFFMKQSAAYRTEMDCWLLEEDGTAWEWRQFPGELSDPVQVFPPASRIEAQHVSTAKLDRMLRILAD